MSQISNAFVTLLTDSSYLPGALVLFHSLQTLHPEPRNFKIVCLVTPETVDARSIGALRNVGFDLVIGVEPISSGIAGLDDLRLMGRPDLYHALTKLHVFRLNTLFATIIYLDADTLPLQPMSDLFESTAPNHFSACPDIGWPDCFNSGVMVIRPRASDFDSLRGLLRSHQTNMKGNGSFDGADQGLLNKYFSEDGPGGPWHRLPFVYNVTPNAAYQYAPAYKHFAHKIKLIHFIGRDKPWSNLSSRPARTANRSPQVAYDFASLIDRWYALYDQHVRPTSVHEPNLAKRFAVPEHIAVWNRSDHPASTKDRLGLTELRAAAEQGLTSIKPSQYISLPLDGRIDLVMPKNQVSEVTAQPDPPEESRQIAGEYHRSQQQRQQPQEQTRDINQQSAWDASRYSPPKSGRPEMLVPMNTFYEPAWDQPVTSQAAYFQEEREDRSPQYPSLPANVKSNDWYQSFTRTTPSRANLLPTFPWEESGAYRPIPSRVFPRTGTPPPTIPCSPGQLGQENINIGGHSHSQHETKSITSLAHVPPLPSISVPSSLGFAESMASYTNAWDGVASIERYAKRLTVLGIGTERRSTSGLQTVPPSPRIEAGSSTREMHINDSPSDGSRDGDDEGEDEESLAPSSPETSFVHRSSGLYPANVLYLDKQAQTDKPAHVDAKVQASLEATSVRSIVRPPMKDAAAGPPVTEPRSSAFVLGHYRHPSSLSASQKQHQQRSQMPPPTLPSQTNTILPLPTYSFDASKPGHRAQPSSGRSWDPSTDIESRKKDSQQVLSRLMRSG